MTNIENVDPAETWNGLQKDNTAVLVDVRTRAEWGFVGIPDLSQLNRQPFLIEWKEYPMMNTNEAFASELLEKLDGAAPSKIYFLCRSGARSMAAANLMSEIFATQGQATQCINVAEGFEGDLDSDGHRGNMNGWKARGLDWRQS
ncbi:hypothetical protein GCM10008927_09610 [Amylibacter ulvae]|uniref:Rhodanese domain-containing protein n=1 Tax=Paramylibacter ulvae TaxID=1651968 RepID=A0ABQ3CW56_9RHOB|nr:rhodanese-like domain-containing protein [Amylibacter ulvae]GHA46919.1 hypothetical protein GCM10008927_09610 [Amylibacter ulvae]